jgi:hypothetical protein
MIWEHPLMTSHFRIYRKIRKGLDECDAQRLKNAGQGRSNKVRWYLWMFPFMYVESSQKKIISRDLEGHLKQPYPKGTTPFTLYT